MIETDNMAAMGAASKLSSKSEDMQELVRRLLELAEQFEITIRLTHTPGVKLDRPDQTSRGDPAEEPRAREHERPLRLHRQVEEEEQHALLLVQRRELGGIEEKVAVDR